MAADVPGTDVKVENRTGFCCHFVCAPKIILLCICIINIIWSVFPLRFSNHHKPIRLAFAPPTGGRGRESRHLGQRHGGCGPRALGLNPPKPWGWADAVRWVSCGFRLEGLSGAPSGRPVP